MRLFLFLFAFLYVGEFISAQPRVVIMTDFPPVDVIPGGAGYGPAEKRSDPDDVQSMVRFLLYTNELKVEGLVASAATLANIAQKQNILDLLYLYDRVDENLRRHDNRYPETDYLRSVTWEGASGSYGGPAMDIIGKGKDSEASRKIIALLDQPDSRPVWFCVWGGSCDLAQALWTIKETRNAADVERLIHKVRVYLIGLQDGTGQWLTDTFPELFVILSKGNYMGMCYNSHGSDTQLSNLEWINKNIRKGHGILGAVYPESGYNPVAPGVIEGDTPSFLYLLSGLRGINDPEKPDQESWGGQFVRVDQERNLWTDHPSGAVTVWKWRSDVQKEFAERADWMLDY
ncbi:MAG TPA: DUF1593 domain-containing protein [Prolixibacteraceae bacterium]|nr:DUF1593 domain-containing protein [Prolixibacteraceae bacterium]